MKPVFLIDLVNPIIFVPMVLLPPLDPAMGDLVPMVPPPPPLDPAMGEIEFETLIQHWSNLTWPLAQGAVANGAKEMWHFTLFSTVWHLLWIHYTIISVWMSSFRQLKCNGHGVVGRWGGWQPGGGVRRGQPALLLVEPATQPPYLDPGYWFSVTTCISLCQWRTPVWQNQTVFYDNLISGQ